MNRVFRRWLQRRPFAANGPHRPSRDQLDIPLPAADDDAPPKGCAWYDSSLDLKRGLLVRECAIQIVNV